MDLKFIKIMPNTYKDKFEFLKKNFLKKSIDSFFFLSSIVSPFNNDRKFSYIHVGTKDRDNLFRKPKISFGNKFHLHLGRVLHTMYVWNILV